MDGARRRLRTQLPEPLSQTPERPRLCPSAGPAAPIATLSLPERCTRELALLGGRPDAAQLAAAARLETLRVCLTTPSPGWLRWWHPSAPNPAARGLYLWGPVGRGKTWLMDLFYDSLSNSPGAPTRLRLHFHHFMRDVHALLRGLRRRRDPLQAVARRFVARARLLCLDELFVADIADAMILGGLFEALLDAGATLVITSNTAPAGLYRDGLQRARFLPAIALLERTLQVVSIDGGADYRLRQLQRRPIYIASDAPDADAQLRALFDGLAEPHAAGELLLMLHGRRLRARARRGAVVWFSFAALCEGPRSQADYVEIAREFQTVLVSDVPCFAQPQQDDAARRFIALVDELYDQGVKLIVSAAAAPLELYRSSRLQFEFQRTASRLIEMQTEAYLAREHRHAEPQPAAP